MATVSHFEDIEAWKKARNLSKEIYMCTGQGDFRHDYNLRDQIRRAVISVMSNIAEGFERGSNKEFIQYLYIAKGSTAEVEAQLYIALDNSYINQEKFNELKMLTKSIKSLLAGFIRYLSNSNQKGHKYKQRVNN